MSCILPSCHNGNFVVNLKNDVVAFPVNDADDLHQYNIAMTTTSSTHAFLALWRKEKGFTQEQLGNILGVDKSAISRWENGERHMSLEDIERIARIFGVEPVALFLSPNDYGKAKALDEFSKLVDQIGLDRATAIITALKPV